MKNLILFIVLCIAISFTVYAQEIPTMMQRNLLVDRDPYNSVSLDKKPLMERSALYADYNVEYISSFLWASAKNVKVSDNYVYCICANGLVILNKSNLAKITQIYLGGNGGSGQDVFLNGSYAYIANGGSGLQIIDVSNPASPVLVGGYDTPGTALGVSVIGNYAYVVDNDKGLQIVNVSNPAAPVLAGSYDTPGNAYGVTVSGNYAYVADGSSGLQIINVSNPAVPVLAGGYHTSNACGVYVIGNYAYVADAGNGLQIIDVSNPAAPVLAGSYSNSQCPAYKVIVSGNYAYIAASGYGLKIINVSNPASPVLAGEYSVTANGVTVNGGYAYVTDPWSGLNMISINNPSSTLLAGRYSLEGASVQDVTVIGTYAYIIDYSKGLMIFDVSNLTTPALAGSCAPGGAAGKLMINGNYAYTANGGSGLQIINVSNPASPVLMGSYDTPGSASGVYVIGNYAYVSDGGTGLQIVNVSNPASPVLMGSYDTPGSASGVYVNANYAYVADYDKGLQIINVSNPALPVLAGSYDTPGLATGVSVNGTYAYVADQGALRIINVSNPASPNFVGSFNTGAYDVRVNGNYAYVACGASGLNIFNVSNPASPILMGGFDTPGNAYGVYVSGNYAYVADEGSLMILKSNLSSSNNTPPTASFTVTPSSGATSTIFNFNASGSSDSQDSTSLLQVRWDWENDGIWDTQFSTTKTTTHQYNTAGIYTINLEVRDTGGLTATTTKSCNVGSGHFRPAYTTTGSNSTVMVPTSTTIKIDGNNFSLASDDEIAIYNPLSDTLCCGVGKWTGSNLAITVWGDNDQTSIIKEGFTAGQEYRFYLWDASESREYRNFSSATFSSGNSTYSANGLSVVSSLVFSTIDSLSIALPSGWNMISSNVSPQFPRMDSVFQSIVTSVVIAKNNNGQVYWPEYGVNQIGSWRISEGYQIYMRNTANLTIKGQRVNPSTPISLPAGWSIIAYLPNVPMSPARACTTIRDKIVIMKDVSGKVYWPRFNIDQIGTMQAGMGYQIYLSSAGTLIYPASAAKEGNPLIVENRNRSQMSPQHFAYIRVTGANATILMRMNEEPVVNGTALEVGDEIGVFTSEGICAGAGVWSGDDIVITVWGDNGETMNIDGFTDGQAYTFKLWDKNTNVEKDVSVIAESGNLTYSENGITIISYEKSAALPDNFVLRQNYPNPFNPSTRIEYQIKKQSEVTLAIYNTSGQLLRMLVQSSQPAGMYSVEWDGKNSSGVQVPSGIYLYRLRTGSFVETRKMVVLK